MDQRRIDRLKAFQLAIGSRQVHRQLVPDGCSVGEQDCEILGSGQVDKFFCGACGESFVWHLRRVAVGVGCAYDILDIAHSNSASNPAG